MNADGMPIEIAFVLLIEFLFGIGFNSFTAWAHKHNLMHVSSSVVVGVAGTIIAPTAFWFDHEFQFWQIGIILFLCFAASGVPMIVGSQQRTVAEKDHKKRRPWPTQAMRARDDAVMDLSKMADEIAEKSKLNKLTVQDLPSYVHKLHQVIGTLKSV